MPSTTVTKLRFGFKDAGDDKIYKSFNYADDEAEAADVKALGEAIVTNGTLWERAPVSLESAEFISTTTTPVDVSGD